jgi:DNA polymerase III epsilon subunit family exonuclease
MQLIDQPIEEVPIASLDMEMTGLDKDSDRVIEVAVVRRNRDQSIERWSTLLDPQCTIPSASQKIHGITDAMVSNAPYFIDIAPKLNEMLEGTILIGHHIQSDIDFMQAECLRADLAIPLLPPSIDTLQLVRNVYQLPRCNLSTVAKRFGILVHSAHRALHDAHNTLVAFQSMIGELPTEEPLTAREIQRVIDKYNLAGSHRKSMLSSLQTAMESGKDVIIDFVSSDPRRPISQSRRITIKEIKQPHLIAYCHLRQARRSFRINRIRKVLFEEGCS